MDWSKPSRAALVALQRLRSEVAQRAAREAAYEQAQLRRLPGEQQSLADWWAQLPEQPVLQGVYRGYAGDNTAMAAEGPLFVANQRPMAELFAARRAAQAGADPHLEMFLMDPAVGGAYRIQPPEAREMSVVRKVDPRVLSGRTQLFRRGGLAQLKRCSCHG